MNRTEEAIERLRSEMITCSDLFIFALAVVGSAAALILAFR